MLAELTQQPSVTERPESSGAWNRSFFFASTGFVYLFQHPAACRVGSKRSVAHPNHRAFPPPPTKDSSPLQGTALQQPRVETLGKTHPRPSILPLSLLSFTSFTSFRSFCSAGLWPAFSLCGAGFQPAYAPPGQSHSSQGPRPRPGRLGHFFVRYFGKVNYRNPGGIGLI